MAIIKKIKNNTGSNKTYKGQVIAPGQYYEIQALEDDVFKIDPILAADIASGDAVMNDGTSDLSISEGQDLLECEDASCLKGVHIDDTAKADGKSLVYKSSSGKVEYETVAGTTDHTALSNIGTNTHAQIDSHVASTSNPHSVTKAQVGLSNVDNTTDAGKPVSTAQQTALNLKANLASPTFTGTVGGITKTMVGLGSVDNTADSAKSIAGDVTGTLAASVVAKLRGRTVASTLPTNGQALAYNTSSSQWEPQTISGGAPSDMTIVTARRSTTSATTASWVNLTFDTTVYETNAATIDHDNTNRDRIVLKEAGAYLITYDIDFDTSNTSIPEVRVLLNGSTEILGSHDIARTGTNSTHVTCSSSMLYIASANDYAVVQVKDSASSSTLRINATFEAVRLTGATGATGAAGIAGADGDMTWQGNWVSQNYTANQAVKYTNGNSYVCHTNTTSNQVPTDTGYWDVLAEKGDAGNAQKRIDISVHPHNDDKKNTTSATYFSQAKFIWGGSTLLGTPTKIYANSFQAAAGSGNVRIYDITNSQVIAASASITTTSSGNIVNLGTISNVSSGQAVWEIQNKSDGTNTNYISSVSVEF